jgi:hypothetical protein
MALLPSVTLAVFGPGSRLVLGYRQWAIGNGQEKKTLHGHVPARPVVGARFIAPKKRASRTTQYLIILCSHLLRTGRFLRVVIVSENR